MIKRDEKMRKMVITPPFEKGGQGGFILEC